MAEKAKRLPPPYAAYSAFVTFINKLRDNGIPSRIDASIFGNASGSLSYSIISALKSLKLVDDSGIPNDEFSAVVKASDDDRKPLMQKIIRRTYPSLFSAGTDLTAMTAGQFDERMRAEFDVQGSTVDKIASFFIAAATATDIPISTHLKNRKPTTPSSSSRKSAKQRRQEDDGDDTPPYVPPQHQERALEYQLIDLMKEPDIDDQVKQSIWSLVQYLTARQAKRAGGGT